MFPCTKHIGGEETIKILLEEWFCVNGAPKEINSEEDVRVRSDTGWYKRVLRYFNVQVSTGIPYTHTSNPLCERQPVPPALLPGQGPEALQQGPPLDTATTVQQRGRDGADGAQPDVTNGGAVAWMAACRHLARDTTGLRQYRPTDRTALASAVAAVTMGPVAAWPAQLLPHVPCRDTQPRQPAATHAPTAPLTAEQLYDVAAALLADGGESFVHHHGPAQIAGSIQGTQRDAPDPWRATLRGRTRVWDAGDGKPPPGPQQKGALVLQTAGYQAILHDHAGGYRSHVLAGGRWTVWHSTARQGTFPPLPHVDWQQGPTQAYYMSADPWQLAVLLHTVSAPNKRQEPRWVDPPALVWSPD